VAIQYDQFTSETSPRKAGKRKSKEPEVPDDDTRWWVQGDSTDAAARMIEFADRLKKHQGVRNQQNILHSRLYSNSDVSGLGLHEYTNAQSTLGQLAGRISLNVIQSCVDTLLSKICKNKPRPAFVTNGANWPQQQKAKKLERFTQGVFYEEKLFEKSIMVGLDALVFGTGAFKFQFNPDTGRLEAERAFIDEIRVDDADGVYGKPRQMFQRRLIAKDVLLDCYPGQADVIRGLPTPEELRTVKGAAAMCEVWESWHLRSGSKAKDGKHMIAVQGACLYQEEWTIDRFPFAFLRYKPKLLGFWGCGVAEVLTGIQIELNRLVRSVSEQLRRKGRGRIFVQVGSKIVPGHMTNNIADIINYVGHPPIVDSGNAVAPEEFAQIDRLYQKAFQECGISQLSVSAQKPSGLDAAVALREFSDIESERFAKFSQGWEQLFLDAAEVQLDLMRMENPKDYEVSNPHRRFTEKINWKDVNLLQESYAIQMTPVSSLPDTKSARLQRVEELKNGGYITQAIAAKLLDMPDIDAETKLGTAAIEDVEATISAILDDAKPCFYPPEEYQNLQLLMERSLASYLYAKHHGCDEERLSMLRDLMDQTKALLAPPPPPPAPAQGAPPPMPPMGGPMPPGPMPPMPMQGGQPPNMSMQNNTNVKIPLQPTVAPLVG
jgi:hypothetical protein